MNVLMLSSMDGGGGAGRAALRLHKAFLNNSVQSSLWVGSKSTDIDSIVGHQDKYILKAINASKNVLIRQIFKLQNSQNINYHSLSLLPSMLVNKINKENADIVQLNWVCNEFISIEDIGRIKKPIVWRLSDMWPFCGTEHISDDGPKARWRDGYSKTNRIIGDSGLDLDRWAWQRKLKAWKKPIQIVAPSNWMADCVRNSKLMKDWPVAVIPATIDVERFKPWNKIYSRNVLGLPLDKKLILFGAASGTRDPNKGADLLNDALVGGLARGLFRNAEGVIFGQSTPTKLHNFGIKTHWLGQLKDEISLSIIYSAADLVVVPSRQDNLPQVALEAQACGCPVVGFKTSGMPDAVKDRETGYLARPFETEDLAFGMDWVLSDETRYYQLSDFARKRAVKLWSPDVVVKQYKTVYEKTLSNCLR